MMGFLEDERVRRYLEALQKERKKIQMFQRELPLCYELISQALESYGQQMVCDEETSINVPVLEEFIPIKRMRSVEEKGEEEGRKDVKGSGDHEQNQAEKKPDWLRSVRLWTQNLNPPKQEAKIQKPLALDARKVKGAFHPFCGDWKNTAIVEPTTTPTPALASTPTPPPLAATSSTGDAGGSGGGGHVKDRYSNRKPRRCWSPELHRRFLHAVQELGGSHAATPKQIGELMKVDGLTNDEVKSHLQKYRLHTRRSSSSVLTSNGDGVQTPQFILVGGIWVPPPPAPECTAAKPVTESSAARTSRIYAPVASVPTSSTCNSAKGNKSGGGVSTNSTSAATSVSSLTVTASAGL